jgi:hypothetical protein
VERENAVGGAALWRKKNQIPQPPKTPFEKYAQGKRVRDDSFEVFAS